MSSIYIFTFVIFILSYYYNKKKYIIGIISHIQESAGFGNKMAGITSALAFCIISDKILYCINIRF